jgi:exonuclease SbcC
LQDLQEVWAGFSIHPAAIDIPDEEKSNWLNHQLASQREIQKSLHQQLRQWYAEQKILEEKKNQLGALDKSFSEISNAIKDADRKMQSLQEQGESISLQRDSVTADMKEIEKTLSPFFDSDTWFTVWEKNSDHFINHITAQAAEWNNNTALLDEHIRARELAWQTLAGMEEQSNRLIEEFQRKDQRFSEIKLQLDTLLIKRKAIFGGEPVAEVEAELKLKLNEYFITSEKHKTSLNNLQTEITRITTLQDQTELDLAGHEIATSDLAIKIEQWINTYNTHHSEALTLERLKELLLHEAEWIETERSALRAIDDRLNQAQTVLNEREDAVKKHEQLHASQHTSDELKSLLEEALTLLKKANDENAGISFRLREDENNRKKIGGLLKVIEARAVIVENWAKLNDVIGSADGKKFRQIAQEYTLDVLITYANVHLELLSKRYSLQRIPNSLGLQVMDKDMGNEIRTVYSLSGGESFLLSLALALGLASLSTSRMKVESLFIDEGFGSLDPTTLNIAMDALERLHNQGRKVGVISHVQEMTERVPVQIKVTKHSNGRSKAEVIGN